MGFATYLSGRVKKVSGSDLDSDRGSYLDLKNAEPNLGNPSTNDEVVLSKSDGTRFFATLGNLLSYDGNTGSINVDSAQVVGIVQGEGIDSDLVTDLIDSAYVQARQSYNATTLNGQSGGYYLDWNNFSNIPDFVDSADVSSIILNDVDSAYVTARAFDQSLNTTDSATFAGLTLGSAGNQYSFPTADGTAGYAIVTDGNGQLSFATVDAGVDSASILGIFSNGSVDTLNFTDSNSILSWDSAAAKLNFTSGIQVNGDIAVTGTVDGRDVATDGTKLDGIEPGATADQTITAGAGLTGGGTGDVTLNVGAGSGITVLADTINVNEGAVNHDNLLGFVANEHVDHSGVSITAGNGLTGGGNITTSRTLNIGQGTGITVDSDSISVNESAVNHDNLLGFVADEHIAHSSVTLNAGAGLTGGGDLTVSRTFNVGAGTGITVAADSISVNEGQVNHDNLSGFVTNEHIDHSTVVLTAGAGLTGGGDITVSRTLNIGQGTGITVAADSISVNEGAVNHDNLLGFVGNEHIDHSSIGITAGAGLTGGGDLTATRTLNIGAGTGITVDSDAISVNESAVNHDNLSGFVADEHIAHSGVTMTAGAGLTGGGTIAASRTFNVGAGTGVTVNADNVAIGQDVATTADVTFNTVTTTGDVTIGGNLQVTGTTTTVNSQSLEVTDNMIYMNAGESDGSPTQSIDVGWAANVNDDGSYTHVGMFRDATDNRFKVFGAYTPEPDAAVEIDTGHASFALADFQAATFYGALSGNATTASTLQTARTISLGGDVSGSVSFDGSSNVTITTTVADDSHNHTIANVDGLQSALDAKLNASAYTAADVLSKLLTVDGSTSGLDADLLDGQDGAYYLDYNNLTNVPNAEIVNDNTITISAGSGMSGGGAFTVNQNFDETITISHADTSTASSVNNSNGTVIQDVGIDSNGHVTSFGSVNLDNRYYTETEADSLFVNVAGDTMTGALNVNAPLRFASDSSGANWLKWERLASNSWRLTSDGVGPVMQLAGNLLTIPQDVRIQRGGLDIERTFLNATPALGITETWNDVGTTFTAIQANITDTTSAASSKLIDLQVDGSTQFSVSKDGNITVTGTVDGRDIATDGTKLDGIEANAKDDQTITAGNGLTGGGTGDVTLNVGGGTGITVTANAISTNDSQIVHDNLSGFVANEHIDHSNVTLTAGSGLTGGGNITASRTFNIGQGTGITVSADAISTNDSQIVHDNLSGFVADEHVAHSGVSITAGAGLTGGGTIAASRTINVGAGTGVTVNADNIAIGQDVATTADVTFNSVTTTGNVILDEYVLNSQTATLATTTQTQIAAFTATTYGSAEVLITAKTGVNRHITKLLIVHDGTTASATEYGTIWTSGSLATYEVDISGGNVRVLATGASATSTVYNVALTLMDA